MIVLYVREEKKSQYLKQSKEIKQRKIVKSVISVTFYFLLLLLLWMFTWNQKVVGALTEHVFFLASEWPSFWLRSKAAIHFRHSGLKRFPATSFGTSGCLDSGIILSSRPGGLINQVMRVQLMRILEHFQLRRKAGVAMMFGFLTESGQHTLYRVNILQVPKLPTLFLITMKHRARDITGQYVFYINHD